MELKWVRSKYGDTIRAKFANGLGIVSVSASLTERNTYRVSADIQASSLAVIDSSLQDGRDVAQQLVTELIETVLLSLDDKEAVNDGQVD